jgi:hypothetical protein
LLATARIRAYVWDADRSGTPAEKPSSEPV